MNFRRTWMYALIPASTLTIALAGGCGSDGESTFGDGNGNNGGGDGGPGGVFGEGGSGDGVPQSVDDLKACATTNAGGALGPINLVVMYDRSWSMVSDGDNDVTAQKCTPASQAMKAFFSSAESKGISATINFFGLTANGGGGGGGFNFSNSCTHNYEPQEVGLTALPSDVFAGKIDAKKPGGDEIPNTPTRAALKGAVAHAIKIKGTTPSAVVLVTDGYPQFCNDDDDIAKVAGEAKTGLDGGVKTYVLGVGDKLDNLKAIATAGGTTAVFISVGDATKTQNELRAALGRVSSELTSCKMPLPAPPSGQALDKNAVNVSFTPAGSGPQLLDYKGDCSGPGWRYDNLDAPTQIELCPTTCETVRANAGGKVDIAFGCKTKIAIR